MTNKHIVILTPAFAADAQDSTCIPPLQDYVKSYNSIFPDDKMSIISLQYPLNRGSYHFERSIVYSVGGRGRRYLFKILTWFRTAKTFKKLNNEFPVTVIHSFWLTECSLLGQYLSRKYRVNHVITAMGQDVKKSNAYLKLLDLKTPTIVALSAFSADQLEINARIKAKHIISFGLDQSKFSPTSKRAVDVLGVGSLVPVKNFSLFVKVISLLKPDFPHISVVIIGEKVDEEETEKLASLIKLCRLEENISLLGKLQRSEVFEYMQQCKVLLHTSNFEGQGMVTSEALACGMQVVCTNVGLIHPEKMIVCSNEQEMRDSIANLLLDNNIEYTPLFVKSMEKTSREYNNLY
jgi:glycosyltransferase involved in cell wall biosynthesis